MHSRAAADDKNIFIAAYLFRSKTAFTEVGQTVPDSGGNGVPQSVRLLVYLFQHEMLVAALLRGSNVPGRCKKLLFNRLAVHIGKAYAAFVKYGYLSPFKAVVIAGMLQNSGNV